MKKVYQLRQESNSKINFEGKNTSLLKHTWSAQWITHPTASVLEYGVFLFRRTFRIKIKPNKFVINVSADNRYKLFVNGKQICFGPAIGSISNYKFDEIDIAKLLVEGKNIVAVEVVNFGEYRRVAQQTFLTAFILQCDRNNKIIIDTGDGKWKVIQNRAYKSIPFVSEDLHGYYAAGPGSYFNAEKHLWGWQNILFDDSSWLTPRKATIEFAAGRGFIYGSTWFLVPREIPFMEEKEQRLKKVVRSTNNIVKQSFIKGKTSVTIPANSQVSILLDNGSHTIGFPQLVISKGLKSRIKIIYSESLISKKAFQTKYVSGNIQAIDVKGNRNEIDDKRIFGIYDIIWSDGKSNRLFTPLWLRTFRYIQLEVKTSREELIINDFKNIFVAYPFKEKAKFKTDSLILSEIWEIAWRTLRNSAGEMYRDTPYYEQLQYIGDTRISALVSIYVSNDDRLFRNAIKQFYNSRIPEGLTQSRYPSYIQQVIPTFSLFWISMISDFLYYRNDAEFVEPFLSSIRDILEWFVKKIDHTNMLTNMEWWIFVDWANGFQNGIPPGADNGYSSYVSFQFIYTLNQAVDIFRYFGWSYEARQYKILATKIKKAVVKKCFNKQKKMFAETPGGNIFSQHTNIMAILSDSITKSKQKSLMMKILGEKDLIQTTIYFKFYLFRALQKTGMANKYLDLLSPWENMVNNGLTTFAEKDENPRSDCHAWSSSPCFDFLHTVAGIYPTKYGFKDIRIEPNFGYLKKIKAQVPHPKGGVIKVDLKRIGNFCVKGSVSLPKNQYGSFIWQGKKIVLSSGIKKISI
jgi:hypothetical protein